MHYKITIFGACAPHPGIIYWISSISQWNKDDMSSKSGPYSCRVAFCLEIPSTLFWPLLRCPSVSCLVSLNFFIFWYTLLSICESLLPTIVSTAMQLLNTCYVNVNLIISRGRIYGQSWWASTTLTCPSGSISTVLSEWYY